MLKRCTCILLILFVLSCSAFAQVDEITKAAAKGVTESSGGTTHSGGFLVDLFFNVMIGEVIAWQHYKLEKREETPGIVSLDVMLQGAAKPSDYYILTPRIRGNWGLFSTDFRINYLIEEDIDGFKHLRTNDWQIIQLNLVTTKDVTFRMGAGLIHEAFGEENTHGEWTAGLSVHPSQSLLGGAVEYRDSEARREVNGYVQYKVFDKGILHGYATAGVMFQRYYRSINVWGMQGGLIVRLY